MMLAVVSAVLGSILYGLLVHLQIRQAVGKQRPPIVVPAPKPIAAPPPAAQPAGGEPGPVKPEGAPRPR